MKKIFAVALISLTLISCKKSSSPGIGTNGLQVTLAGKAKVYNVVGGAFTYTDYSGPDSTVHMYIYFYDNTNANLASYFEVDLQSYNSPFTLGTVYSDTSTVGRYTDFEIGSDFDPHNSFINYYTAGNPANPSTTTITAISATSISGTFQGIMYDDGDTTKLSKTVTNGKFIASIFPD